MHFGGDSRVPFKFITHSDILRWAVRSASPAVGFQRHFLVQPSISTDNHQPAPFSKEAEELADSMLSKMLPRIWEASWWPPGVLLLTPEPGQGLPAWTTFEPMKLKRPRYEARLAAYRAAGLPDPSDESYMDECTAFFNSRYCVLIHDAPATSASPALWHVMIQRRDGQPPGPERYKDFMRVRDELVGEEHEALEMYPRRSREIDAANVYHLWVVQSDADEFSVGFK